MFVCMWIQCKQVFIKLMSQDGFILIWRQGLSLSWNSPIWLGWLTSESKEPSVSTSSLWDYKCMLSRSHFYVGPGG